MSDSEFEILLDGELEALFEGEFSYPKTLTQFGFEAVTSQIRRNCYNRVAG